MVNFIEPNFQDIIFTLSTVSLTTQKQFLDHLKNRHFLGPPKTLNETVAMALQDIENPDFWNCLYITLCAVFPALRLLRYCDKSKPALEKIYYLSHHTTQAMDWNSQNRC